MRDIKAMLPEEIAAALAEMGQPKYRAKQIFQWLARGASSFDEMTNLSKDLRAALAALSHLPKTEVETISTATPSASPRRSAAGRGARSARPRSAA